MNLDPVTGELFPINTDPLAFMLFGQIGFEIEIEVEYVPPVEPSTVRPHVGGGGGGRDVGAYAYTVWFTIMFRNREYKKKFTVQPKIFINIIATMLTKLSSKGIIRARFKNTSMNQPVKIMASLKE
jgi:hypothetical protein